MTTIYNYSNQNGEYLGQAEARPDPLDEGKFLIPAYATEDMPPVVGVDQTTRFVNGAWELVPDFRGTKYWLADGSRHKIDSIDVVKPADGLDAEPPPQLKEARATKIAEIKAEAMTRITAADPDIEDEVDVRMLTKLWPALNTAALPAEVLLAKDIYAYARGKITQTRTATRAQLSAYDPTADAGWPS